MDLTAIHSSTSARPVVFTAQSKQTFYCRDAVCEFVLKAGAVPLNPFRLFGYFLGDRVERDLIREANNNLVRMADELWVFGEEISDGMLFELLYARQLGKPIRHFGIDSRADRIQTIENDAITFEPEVIRKTGVSPEEILRRLFPAG